MSREPTASWGEVFKYSGIVFDIVIFAVIGYIVGQQFGKEMLGALIGTLFGTFFMWLHLFRVVKKLESKRKQK